MKNIDKKKYTLNETLARHNLKMNKKGYTAHLYHLCRCLDRLKQEREQLNNGMENFNTLPFEQVVHPQDWTKEECIDEINFRLKWNLIHIENTEKEISKYEKKLKCMFDIVGK